jgi:hypothetical protein
MSISFRVERRDIVMRSGVGHTIHSDFAIARPDVRRTCRSSLIAVLVVGLSLLGVVAAPVSGAAISQDRAKVQFIQDEFVQYNAIGTFIGGIRKLSNSSTDAQVLAVSKPLGRSLEAFQRSTSKQSWPTKARAEVRELSTVSSQAISVLLKSVTNTTSWQTKAGDDIQTWIDVVNIMNHDLGLPSFMNARFVDACQADGATVDTAMAAFHAESHGVVPTRALLTGKKYGGPYLEDWPHNAPHYTYTLNASGKLFLAAPSSAKPGPSDCYTSFE